LRRQWGRGSKNDNTIQDIAEMLLSAEKPVLLCGRTNPTISRNVRCTSSNNIFAYNDVYPINNKYSMRFWLESKIKKIM
jgi:hypothetical protein